MMRLLCTGYAALALIPLLLPPPVSAADEVHVPVDHPALLYSGRRVADSASVRYSNPGARVRMAFRGNSVALKMDADGKGVHVNFYINGVRTEKIHITGEGNIHPVASGLEPDVIHTVEVVKATEDFSGICIFRGFVLPSGGSVETWPARDTRRIKFIGDSITCGYGIEASGHEKPFRLEEENFCLAFAGRTARALGADYHAVARSGIGLHRNYGAPFEGSPAAMPAVFDRVFLHVEKPLWGHDSFRPDLICINLGTNDYSGENRNPTAFEEAGVSFVGRLLELHPQAKILLLSGPMQNSSTLREQLETIRARTNPERVGTFPLSAQGSLGYGAAWHPSARQAEQNSAELVAHLAEWLKWKTGIEPAESQ